MQIDHPDKQVVNPNGYMSTTPNLTMSINLPIIPHTEYYIPLDHSTLVPQIINEFVKSLRVEHQEGVMDDTLRVIEFGRCRVESRQGPFQLHNDLELKLQTYSHDIDI